jgi:hypothetical protein
VYWDENDDEMDLRAKIKKFGFTGEVRFVCLKDYFNASVTKHRKTGPWEASWTFATKRVSGPKAYTLQTIVKAVDKLGRAVERLDPKPELYRTMGFNKSGAEFIECDHWARIRFFTTIARFARDQIPRRLFIKPNGCKYFNGYFDIKTAFVITAVDARIEQFFRDYYFYEHADDCGQTEGIVTCFVGDFKPIGYEIGRELFDFLGKKYALGVRGSPCITNELDIIRINTITAKSEGARQRHGTATFATIKGSSR